MNELNVIETRTQTPEDAAWLRDLLPEERPMAASGQTGDVLPDGSVLLREEDMDRMGLESLRNWIYERVVLDHVTIAIESARMSTGAWRLD